MASWNITRSFGQTTTRVVNALKRRRLAHAGVRRILLDHGRFLHPDPAAAGAAAIGVRTVCGISTEFQSQSRHHLARCVENGVVAPQVARIVVRHRHPQLPPQRQLSAQDHLAEQLRVDAEPCARRWWRGTRVSARGSYAGSVVTTSSKCAFANDLRFLSRRASNSPSSPARRASFPELHSPS